LAVLCTIAVFRKGITLFRKCERGIICSGVTGLFIRIF
jgi:hypothetical protein